MAREDVAAILASTGYPIVYYKWPDGSEPTFPCIRYVYDGDASFRADDINHFPVDRWSATLVTSWKDEDAEAALEEAFAAAGVIAAKYGDYYDKDEKLNHVEYSFQLPK